MQIHIIGQYPPPIGGITIHVSRLIQKLEKANFDVRFYDDTDLPPISILVKIKNLILNYKSDLQQHQTSTKMYSVKNSFRLKNFRSVLFKLIFTDRNKKKIVHYHTKNWKYRASLNIASKLNPNLKLVFTIHSLRDEYINFGWFEKIYLKIALSGKHFFTVTNSDIKNKLVEWGAEKSKITVLHPYLSPEKIQKDYDDIPKSIWDFINSHEPIVSANASKIEFYENEDLYGLDMCVDLCKNLQGDYPSIGFIFCLPSIGKEEYFEELNKKIYHLGISNNFLFVTEKIAFYPVLEKSDVFVRPTNTDGDALSIREAISLGIPAVASDAVERPKGTHVFRNRDVNSYTEMVKEVLKVDHPQNEIIHLQNDDSFMKIIEIYKQLDKI
jgi:glycosyl transferase family 4/glycosyl transferase family 1